MSCDVSLGSSRVAVENLTRWPLKTAVVPAQLFKEEPRQPQNDKELQRMFWNENGGPTIPKNLTAGTDSSTKETIQNGSVESVDNKIQ